MAGGLPHHATDKVIHKKLTMLTSLQAIPLAQITHPS